MGTYNRNGHIHGNFDQNRFKKYDGLGRTYAVRYWEENGWEIQNYDLIEGSDSVEFDRTDLIATKIKQKILVEAAIKRTDLFKYIKSGSFDNGVDVETRKLKYVRDGQRAYINMASDDGSQMLVIPMICLEMAQKDCGDSFKGQGMPSSAAFVMPEHGCHRVRKRCRKGVGQSGEAEDFYRIPYEFIAHYRDVNGVYKPIHMPEKDPYKCQKN